MRLTRVLVVAFACAAAGCGSAKPGAHAGGRARSVTHTVTIAPEPPVTEATSRGPTQRIDVYFLRRGKLAAAGRSVPRTAAVASAALQALFAGPTAAERAAGLTTALAPGEHVTRLDIRNGVAIVDFEPLLSPITPEFAQAVWTLTQFPAIKRLSIELETQDAAEFGRADVEQFAAPIILDAPTPGETVATPLQLRGTADTPNGTVDYEVHAGSGALLKSGSFHVAASGRRAAFAATVPLGARSGTPIELDLFERSGTTGGHTHDVRVPIRIG